MQLSSSSITSITEAPSIIEHVDFLCQTTSATYPTADKLRNINIWYGKVVGKILEVMNGWKWDDSNYTDAPRGAQNLVAGTQAYTLPVAATGNDASTFLSFQRATVLDASGKESTLHLSLDPESELLNAYSTNGLPQVYKLIGKKIYLYPSPAAASTTLTNGLIIYYTRTPDEFTKSDTTQQPGFPAIFHEVLAIGAAYEYLFTRKPTIADRLLVRTQMIIKDLQDLKRNEEAPVAFRTKQTSFN